MSDEADLRIYRGENLAEKPSLEVVKARRALIPDAPPWRVFTRDGTSKRGLGFLSNPSINEVVNAALCLRRPILVQGAPGTGKTTLAYSVAVELGLSGPYRWGITSRTTLREGLYQYDAVGRLHAATMAGKDSKNQPKIGDYLRLGPVGMGFLESQPKCPSVVLIDEIDKSDLDLPNDLLHLFEEGSFEIPELKRLKTASEEVLPWQGDAPVTIGKGEVVCSEFPLIIMTSNREREFPAPFLRRCLRLELEIPRDPDQLKKLIEHRFGDVSQYDSDISRLIALYLEQLKPQKGSPGKGKMLALDQLLNATHLLIRGDDLTQEQRESLRQLIFADLSEAGR